MIKSDHAKRLAVLPQRARRAHNRMLFQLAHFLVREQPLVRGRARILVGLRRILDTAEGNCALLHHPLEGDGAGLDIVGLGDLVQGVEQRAQLRHGIVAESAPRGRRVLRRVFARQTAHTTITHSLATKKGILDFEHLRCVLTEDYRP